MLELTQLDENQIDSPSSSNGGSHSSTGGVSLNNHNNMNSFAAQLNGMQHSHSPLRSSAFNYQHNNMVISNDNGKDQQKKTILQQQHDDRVKRPMKFVNLKK